MVPAHVVPQLVEDCVTKKVNSVHFYTAGFSETGDPAMVEKEKELITKLKANKYTNKQKFIFKKDLEQS